MSDKSKIEKSQGGFDKIKNPYTGRFINKNGPTHKNLIEEGRLDENGNIPIKKTSVFFVTKKEIESIKKQNERKCYGRKKVPCGDDYICIADGKCVPKNDIWKYEHILHIGNGESIYGSKKEILELHKKLKEKQKKLEEKQNKRK